MTVSALEIAYTEITTRVLMRVVEEHPELFVEEAYANHKPPESWKQMWRELIEEERGKYKGYTPCERISRLPRIYKTLQKALALEEK